jgi:glycosyltransferase involved in cell wall biosynthesis
MALLEAMYYECEVIAWAAPGPDYILRDGETGWIVHNDEEVISRILNGKNDTKKGHDEIIGSFTWRKTADIMRQPMIRDISPVQVRRQIRNRAECSTELHLDFSSFTQL